MATLISLPWVLCLFSTFYAVCTHTHQYSLMVSWLCLKWQTIIPFDIPTSFTPIVCVPSYNDICPYFVSHELLQWVEKIKSEWVLCSRIIISPYLYNSHMLSFNGLELKLFIHWLQNSNVLKMNWKYLCIKLI